MSLRIVNFSKKEAIFQLWNCLHPCSVSQVTDFADGEIFQNTIHITFPDFTKVMQEDLSKENVNAKTRKSLRKCNRNSVFKPNEYHTAKHEAVLLKFNYIQKFIDDHYEIKSEDIISYSKCMKSCELELIKVAIFVLSETVRHLFNVRNGQLQVLYHLEVKYQVELEECFKLLISERDKISKVGVEKLLSKSSRNGAPFVMPRQTSSKSIKQESASLNSPLKAYFESPDFRKRLDDVMKEKKIQNLKKFLDNKDEECLKLQHKLSEQQNKLQKKDEEYKQLLEEMAEVKKKIQVLENCQNELFKSEKEKLLFVSSDSKVCFGSHAQELQRIPKEKENLEEPQRKKNMLSSQTHKNSDPMIINALENENEVLRDQVKNLELKMLVYKKQLSDKILRELNESKSLDEEENIEYLIEENNTALLANLRNKRLDTIEMLKKQTVNKNKKLKQQKEVFSVATMTVPKLIHTANTFEIRDKFRNSSSYSKDVEHCPSSSYVLQAETTNEDERMEFKKELEKLKRYTSFLESKYPILSHEKSGMFLSMKQFYDQVPGMSEVELMNTVDNEIIGNKTSATSINYPNQNLFTNDQSLSLKISEVKSIAPNVIHDLEHSFTPVLSSESINNTDININIEQPSSSSDNAQVNDNISMKISSVPQVEVSNYSSDFQENSSVSDDDDIILVDVIIRNSVKVTHTETQSNNTLVIASDMKSKKPCENNLEIGSSSRMTLLEKKIQRKRSWSGNRKEIAKNAPKKSQKKYSTIH